MLNVSTVENPSFTEVYAQSWSAARGVLARRSRFYWVWIAAAALLGALSLLVPDSIMQSTSGNAPAVAMIVSLAGFSLMAGVLAYFVLADAVRTIVPSFAMTPRVFLFVVVINWATSFAIQIAMYCLVIPAFYVAPKIWLWLPNYLLWGTETTDLSDAVVRSWRDTNNLYWPTFGLMALVVIVGTTIAMVGLAICGLLIQVYHPLAIVATPLLLAVSVYLIAQVDTAWLHWAIAIRRHADALAAAAPATAPVPTTP